MGLDLYHVIPSIKTGDGSKYFYIHDFDQRPDFIERYKHLIIEIIEPNRFFEILIFPTSIIKDIYFSSRSIGQHQVVLIEDNSSSLENDIRLIENKYQLDSNSRFDLHPRDNLLSNQYGQDISYLSVNYPISYETNQIIFCKVKGYQRKGMNKHFYEEFENYTPYFNKIEVIKASQYLNPPSKVEDDLRIHFQQYFIDNFVEGESIFYGSW